MTLSNRLRRRAATAAVVGLAAAALCLPTAAAQAAPPAGSPNQDGGKVTRTVSTGDRGAIEVTADGTARRVDASGKVLATEHVSPGVDTPLGEAGALSDSELRELLADHAANEDAASVIAVLDTPVSGTGKELKAGKAPLTTALRKAHATRARPLFPNADAAPGAAAGTDSSLGSAVVITVPKGTGEEAAAALRAAGASFAEPNRFVSSMKSGSTPLHTSGKVAAPHVAKADAASGRPSNFGLTSSLQSFLNAGGVNAMGAYQELTSSYGQLPGEGEIITNVSVGDLTDASMDDEYVKHYGPTTVVRDGQRYLDLPSMPLIPTYTVDPQGRLDPTGSTKNQDPVLGEVLLDFGVMAPLPHDKQRAGAVGSGVTDLLGIAPGADYRLVVPQTPTMDQIANALMAAAKQSPKPDVITASLGFGTDSEGFPGRYLEDDPVLASVIRSIVRDEGIVVTISSNDGTRLYTPTSIGPDGGSTPTDLVASRADATTIDDDEFSTTPTKVTDSGAMAIGGTTLDDTLSVPALSGTEDAGQPTFATTRTNGSGTFSSGFGTRLDASAPSDGIVILEHAVGGGAQDVTPVISGGTSASAPEVAASAAVLMQAAKLGGKELTPEQVRDILKRTGRAVSTPPQIDRPLQVGNQIDLTAAVDSVLPKSELTLRSVSVAHRVTRGGGGSSYVEDTAQDRIDLSGGDLLSGTANPVDTGMGLNGPVTISGDVTGFKPGKSVSYRLSIGKTHFDSAVPAIRLLPAEMLTAAGLPVVSDTDRSIEYTFSVLHGSKPVDSQTRTLTFGPTDGTFLEAPAPVVPATVEQGKDVRVSYDLRGVRASSLQDPSLVLSHVGHWSPMLSPNFSVAYRIPLKDDHGVVTVPASAFDGGGGLYGIGYAQISTNDTQYGSDVFGEFSSIRVAGGTAQQRPQAPTLGIGSTVAAHQLSVSRAEPAFTVAWDASGVAGASGVTLEISAPAPTLFNSWNTFTNQNGTRRDDDGVDSPSVFSKTLQGSRGSVKLDADTLGLVGSSGYNVRVLPINGSGAVVGQASPSSALNYDDGLAPDGAAVTGFGVASGGTSVVSTVDASGVFTLRAYDAASGGYGAVLASGEDPSTSYGVVGVDAGADRAAVVEQGTGGDAVQVFAPAQGRLVASADLPGRYVSGDVDRARHRAALLVRDGDGADLIVAVDLAKGTLGDPIPVDTEGVAAGSFSLTTVDESTGHVLTSKLSGSITCFVGFGALADVDLEKRSVTQDGGNRCTDALGDGDDGTAQILSYRSLNVNTAGNSLLQNLELSTGALDDGFAVRQQFPQGMAIDGVHHLALVAYGSPIGLPHFGGNLIVDNNATSQLAEVDLTSGKVVRDLGGFDFTRGQLDPRADGRGLQLDPTTRTGWTYSADGRQVQSFRY